MIYYNPSNQRYMNNITVTQNNKHVTLKYLFIVFTVLLVALVFSSCSKIETNAITPFTANDAIGKNVDTVKDDLSMAGFDNITIEPLEDLELTQIDQNGIVEIVSINGITNFEGNVEFKSSSKVIIKYHSFKRINIPFSSEEAKNMDADTLVTALKNAGFMKVSTDEVYDLDPDSFHGESEQSVSIDGISSFEKNEKFLPDSTVRVVTHRPYQKYSLKIEINFVENLIFSRYDVNFEINGHTERLSHGVDAAFDLHLQEGMYTLTFSSVESASIQTSVTINLTGDTEAEYKISCFNDKITVETLYIENKNAIGENEARVPISSSNCKYKNYKEIEEQFKNAGFTNITTSILYDIFWGITSEGEVEEVSINGSTDFTRGNVFDKNASIVITYHMKEEDDPNNKKETETITTAPTITTITIENNRDFADLIKISSTDSTSIKKFVNAHIGDIIEFDGCIAFMMNHGNYNTRFDVAMMAGSYTGTTSGPVFSFENVNYYDMNVSGSDEVSQGMHFRITGKILGYNSSGNYIILEPVSLKAR